MPKVTYNPEKVQKQKKIIGMIAVILLIIVAMVSIIFALNIIIWIPVILVIFAVANLLMRRIGRTPI
ncbi:MAG: hypothetical protein FWF66_03100 [Candidatus Bathyarchaeota archaeon]|nr:hypothetical protein [Candidatus Termiticorpusculum sp.]MCL1970430.1 hypothetical protein [Candidatus Termiticorpusculum sp.]